MDRRALRPQAPKVGEHARWDVGEHPANAAVAQPDELERQVNRSERAGKEPVREPLRRSYADRHPCSMRRRELLPATIRHSDDASQPTPRWTRVSLLKNGSASARNPNVFCVWTLWPQFGTSTSRASGNALTNASARSCESC